MTKDFPILAVILFLGITALLVVLTLLGLSKVLRKTGHPQPNSVLTKVLIAIVLWLGLLSFLSLKGFFADFFALPPRVMLSVMVCMIVIVILATSKKFTKLLMAFPVTWLIVPQAFRIVVEIVLWMLHENENLPIQMSFEGLNFDILAGFTAPLVAYLAFNKGQKNYGLALAWNFISLGLLLNIIIIAIISMPMIGAFPEPNLGVAYFPMILLPGFVAPFALMLHVLSIKQLLKLRKAA